jgi:cell division protein FtsB
MLRFLGVSPSLARKDYQKWARAPFWSIEECIALMFERDPATANTNFFESLAHDPLRASKYQAVLKAQSNKELMERIRPVEFLDWTKTHGIDLSHELKQAIHANEFDIAQLQARYEKLTERHERLRSENRKLHYELDRLKAASTLQQQQKEAPQPNELSTKERTSLYKLVIGMAIGGYKWDRKRTKNAATTLITSDLQNNGVGLDQDTVLKFLREASGVLPLAD